ncbi:TPM domain-containing protein [Pedobacter changchengzhani]|uniref:TPM domain-containing protein n=1 Tax=Pedobacter changchengzhani TaxID=2529274 RepID=A0A4R5MHE5_9SPHI|nr:TPM domain-containing protein [Pedobacter changchengzhani]TDG34948.1 TPM domain-containing protein [Pedobacter changchengzhani]
MKVYKPIISNLFKITSILFFLLCFNSNAFSQKYYKVEDIPNPKSAGQNYFVSNPDGILTNVEFLDSALVNLEKETKVEFAIVVVKNFEENADDFEFALDLFKHWGIGKKGANNGLLLFISTDRRKYRFITGDGVEGLLPDVVLKQTGEILLVPAFKQQDYNAGTEAVVQQISELLTNPRNRAEIQSLIAVERKKSFDWSLAGLSSLAIIYLTFVLFKFFTKQTKKRQLVNQQKPSKFDAVYVTGCVGVVFAIVSLVIVTMISSSLGLLQKLSLTDLPIIIYLLCMIALLVRYNIFVSYLKRQHFDDKNAFDDLNNFHKKYWWLIVFSPLLLIPIIIHFRKRKDLDERFNAPLDSSKKEMIRLDRDVNIEGQPFLSKSQRNEEVLKVFDYDIWQSTDGKEKLIKAWPAEDFDNFDECPKCKAKTFSKPKTEVTEQPTYSSTGKGRVTKECANCKYEEFIEIISLAMLVRSTSSGSSSGSSSSSSSSSSSGSFGGGSSSGGGAGGSW